MKVIVSAAVSADGYLDDLSAERLVLSSAEDWAEVHALRSRCDAILAGAGTLRKDNPALVIRSEALRRDRVGRGMNADLVKVTLSESGNIAPGLRFFTEGEGEKIVFVPGKVLPGMNPEIGRLATVIPMPEVTARGIVAGLERRGVGTLLVEGGSHILNMFFQEDAVDEFRLAVAPFFVGEPGAPRLVAGGEFPFGKSRRMELSDVHRAGDMAVMYYTLKK